VLIFDGTTTGFTLLANLPVKLWHTLANSRHSGVVYPEIASPLFYDFSMPATFSTEKRQGILKIFLLGFSADIF